MARRSIDRRDCYMVCPAHAVGGGMGQVVAYLVREADAAMPLRLVAIDPRGTGSVAWSPVFLAIAVVRVVVGRLSGRLGLLHVHVAERASLVRKGVIAAVAGALGVKVLLHLHAAEIRPFYAALPRWAQGLVRGMFRRADLCVVLGTVWRDWLIETLGVEPGRVVVVRNGVPAISVRNGVPAISVRNGVPAISVRNGVPAAVTPCKPERPAQIRILFLGNCTPRKGVGDLLIALADPALAGCWFEAVFAGGGAVEAYRAQAAALGLAARVRFTGWVDRAQAASLTAEADMLVLPSYNEGLPLVVLEALGAGTAVVCTPVGSIPEVLQHEITALFVPPGDTAALAAALRRLIDDAALRQRLATAGRALHAEQFTMEAFARRLAALHRQLTMIEA